MTKSRIEISDLRLLTWSRSAFSGRARVPWRRLIRAATVVVILSFVLLPSDSNAQEKPYDGAIPGVAHVNGAFGSVWRSDVSIFNAGDTTAQVALSYGPKGKQPGTPITISIGPRETYTADDAVATLFNKNGSGAISWKVTQGDMDDILVNSKTYNRLSETERYGLNVPGTRWEDVTTGLIPALAPIYPASVSRTNISGIGNEECGKVILSVVDEFGRGRGNFTIDEEPNVWWQISDIFQTYERERGYSLPDDDYYVYATCANNMRGEKLMLNTTPADNNSNDGVYFLAQDGWKFGKHWLSGAALVPGLFGSVWQSDAIFINNIPESSIGSIELVNQAVDWRPFEIYPGYSRTVHDIVGREFRHALTDNAKGAVTVETVWQVAPFMVTFTESENGRMGQTVAPIIQTEMINRFYDGYMVGVSEDATTRGSLILQCARESLDWEPLPCKAEVEIIGADGETLDRKFIDVKPFEFWQKVKYFGSRGLDDITNATIKVSMVPDADEFYHGGLDARYSEVNGNRIPGTEDPRLVTFQRVQRPFTDDLNYVMDTAFDYVLNGDLWQLSGGIKDREIIETILGSSDLERYLGKHEDLTNETLEAAQKLNLMLKRLSTLRPQQLAAAFTTFYATPGHHNLDEALRDGDGDGWLVDGRRDGGDWSFDDQGPAPGNDPICYAVRLAIYGPHRDN